MSLSLNWCIIVAVAWAYAEFSLRGGGVHSILPQKLNDIFLVLVFNIIHVYRLPSEINHSPPPHP